MANKNIFMENIILKINNIEDIDEILLVSEKVFRPNKEEKEKHHNKIKWLEKIENGLLVSVFLNNKIIGFTLCYKKEDYLHISIVGVLEEYRRMGIWRKIYNEILKYVVDNNFSKITLNTYKEKFPGMYNFCKKEGFIEYATEVDSLSGNIKSKFSKKL